MPEKKEVRKTKPMARDPTIAEENESTGDAGSQTGGNCVLEKNTGFEGSVLIACLLQLLFQLKKISSKLNNAKVLP